MLDKFLVRYPPADWLVASYLKYQPPQTDAPMGKVPMRQAARMNAGALMPPMKGKPQTIDMMPIFIRTPEMIAHIQKMKTEWQTS
jgi:hypothetical protein